MSSVQFGWVAPLNNSNLPHKEYLRQTRTVLDLIVGHFDSVWFADHLQVFDLPVFESWTTLSYFAALRPELKYGQLVNCQLFRNPALLAKMAATFQYLSQGKFILGLGSGWAEAESRAYGFPFPAYGQRVNELDEQLQIIKALWNENHVSFDGKYHLVSDAICLPHPDPNPSILVGGKHPKMLNLVARQADWWNIAVDTLDNARAVVSALDTACETVGRDPKTLRRTAMVTCYCAPTEQKVKAFTAKHQAFPFPSIVGTPAQVAEQLHGFVEVGFDYFMFLAGDADVNGLITIEQLAHEVLPALNK